MYVCMYVCVCVQCVHDCVSMFVEILSLVFHSIIMYLQVSSEVFNANSVNSDCVLFMTVGDTVTCNVQEAIDIIESRYIGHHI